eukprot:TRINITY_DN18128_c0_g1_i1.p1 TRINITY_DN18128_c0_g1~~TRINITY_DN18128_c0_g1_i1.p1  ORF type:complete len:177 (+),score=50.11 TRINITY_DN18128_c0_g1_i1:19-549(+)
MSSMCTYCVSILLRFIFGFFFFKQKTAYEMLRSLVGSEMCIRDSQMECGTLGAMKNLKKMFSSAITRQPKQPNPPKHSGLPTRVSPTIDLADCVEDSGLLCKFALYLIGSSRGPPDLCWMLELLVLCNYYMAHYCQPEAEPDIRAEFMQAYLYQKMPKNIPYESCLLYTSPSPRDS